MKCPFCSQEITDGSTVCPICGKDLNGAEVSASADAVQTDTVTEETAGDPAQTAADTASQLPETPKKGKKWVIPAAAAAVVVIAAGAFAVSNRKDPKDVVIDAFKSITEQGQTNPTEEIFGVSELTERLNTSSSEMSLELTLDDASDPSISQLASGSIGFNVLNDVENKKMLMLGDLGYAGMDMVTFQFYLDDVQMAAAIPELSSKVFTLNYAEDLEGQLAASPYAGSMLEEGGMDLAALGSYFEKCHEMASSGEQLFNLKELWERYKEGSQAIDDLKAAMTVEKTEKKDYTIDGAVESCQGYQVVITKDALLQFVKTSKDFFLNDETLKSDFIEYMNLVNELQGAMSSTVGMDLTQSSEDMQEQTWQQAEDALNEIITQLETSMGDVSMNVYVRKDGKMAGFDYETTTSTEGGNVKLYGDVSFGGGYNMLANVNGNLNVEGADGRALVMTLSKTGSYEAGKNLSSTVEGTLGDGIDDFKFVFNDSYSVEDGAFDMSLDFLSADVSQVKLVTAGYVENLVKGQSMDINFDSIRLESDAVLGTDGYVEFTGQYTAGPLEQTIEIPEGESFDILASTEEEYNEVLTEITGNVFSLMMNFYQ